MNKLILYATCVFIFLWAIIVIASGAGWNPFQLNWNFSNTGSFGDSFGPLSAAMAAIAAISAVGALRSQHNELHRLQIRELEEDKRNLKADFERTFFQLLEHHRTIRNSIDIGTNESLKTGQDAFRSIIVFFTKRTYSDHKSAWDLTYKRYANDLGHYFRFLYHIIKYVDSQENIDKYFYVRIVRSTLSDSELLAIALNCSWGEGKEKFKELVETYAILHNLSEESIESFKLRQEFSETAFSRST